MYLYLSKDYRREIYSNIKTESSNTGIHKSGSYYYVKADQPNTLAEVHPPL
jgi:hypothetical protein